MKALRVLVVLALVLLAGPVLGQADLELLKVTPTADGAQTWSLSLQVLLLMTVLTLLPSLLLMFTSFTRIIVVLAILRQAMGTGTTPSNQVLIGLALFLTLFVMTPVAMEVNEVAIGPYMNEEISVQQALEQGFEPIHRFMRYQVRESDLLMFASIGGIEAAIEEPDDIPLRILVPAFITSELKTAFQIGFLLFIPFVIIDLAVASVLMSMGMIMLSPMLISLPFKLMLFVLVDGWALISETLVSSFFVGA
ncbi:MAG: flagellar type III secretion system pore protein FliP [Wenzhouxiangellaceae bacterium]|nr:flagellar type III secretion system pore protein FliP [Wenzhouxiangellaceae bacterium]